MKKIALFINRKKDPALEVTRRLLATLSGFELELLGLHSRRDPALEGEIRFVDQEEFYRADCIITLGGDGTILSVAPGAARQGVPILGINLGKVGFMAEVETAELDQIPRLFAGDFSISERMMLEILLPSGEKLITLNECALSCAGGAHMIALSVFEGERKITDIHADGVLFNTPTGSTGYSLSAGGPVVDPEWDCIGLQSICPYGGFAPHMIFSPEAELRAIAETPLLLSADGREERRISSGEEIRVRRAPCKAKLIRLSDRRFYNVFFQKF